MPQSIIFNEILSCNMCNSDNFKVTGIRLNQSQGFRPKTKKGIAVTICKCQSCGLIFSNPQPIPQSFDDQYGISPDEYWKDFAADNWTSKYYSTELNILENIEGSLQNKTALDIGAGTGKAMLSMMHKGMKVYGFEPAKAFYEVALTRKGIDSNMLTCTTLEESNYDNNFFDFITFGAVLEHLHNPDACLKKALQWLKPGGIIHIEVPHSNWLIGKLYNFYYKFICRTNYVTNLSPLHVPYHHFEFTLTSFQKNAALNGYSIVYAKVEPCETELPVKYFDWFLKK